MNAHRSPPAALLLASLALLGALRGSAAPVSASQATAHVPHDGTLWCHLNMGWSGADDLWYAIPDVECPTSRFSFSLVNQLVYNVFPDTTGEFVTGRVTDNRGNPLPGATVTANVTYRNMWGRTYTYGTLTASSGNSGIYSLRIPSDSRTYTVALSATYGEGSSGGKSVSISASQSPTIRNWDGDASTTRQTVGNRWGNDLVVVPSAGAAPAIASLVPSPENGTLSFTFTGTPGAWYEVLHRKSLETGSWSPWAELLLPPPGTATLSLPMDDDSGFWRVTAE